jgi:hypothetical protein
MIYRVFTGYFSDFERYILRLFKDLEILLVSWDWVLWEKGS